MKTEKVYAYITHKNRLLVFRHTHFPEAGIQVPGGTVEEGENPEDAVLREAMEETGLAAIAIDSYLGKSEYNLSTVGGVGIHHRHFFHLKFSGELKTKWRNDERTPSDGNPSPIEFEFFWAKLPEGVPELMAGQGAMLFKLVLDD